MLKLKKQEKQRIDQEIADILKSQKKISTKDANKDPKDDLNLDISMREDSVEAKRVGNALFYVTSTNNTDETKRKKRMNNSQMYQNKQDIILERIAKSKGFDDDEDRDEILKKMQEKTQRRTENRDRIFDDVSSKARASVSNVEEIKLARRQQLELIDTEMPVALINRMFALQDKRK